MRRPLITVPTALPRCSGGASVAVSATSSWATTAIAPTSGESHRTQVPVGASAVSPSTRADRTLRPTMSRRRLSMSPSGRMRNRLAANPSCVSVTISGATVAGIPRSVPIASSKGWL
ncbi:Uncharacterised protein [Mycobacteroides abscessus subsp. abscessus]|nr:Uncharacterised protein [Mycobacteroides abscessus subsp. abscessus]